MLVNMLNKLLQSCWTYWYISKRFDSNFNL